MADQIFTSDVSAICSASSVSGRMAGAFPESELARLAALHAYRVLDTLPEVAFDRVTRLAALILDVPIALISLVDRDRQWFKSRRGVDVDEMPRAIAFCDHAIRGTDVLVVSDPTTDPRFANNPLVTGQEGVRFYAGIPLINADGFALGTLCVLDRVRRGFDDRQRQILRELGQQVVHELAVRATLGELYAEVDVVRQAERRLLGMRRRFEALLNATGNAALTLEGEDRIASWNLAAEKMFGYTAQEAIGLPIGEILPCHPAMGDGPAAAPVIENDAPSAAAQALARLAGGEDSLGRHKDGRTFPVEQSFATWRNESGQVATGAILRDISLRRRQEDDLRRSQTHLAEAQRIGGMGSWDWHIASDEITLSEEMRHLLGLEPGVGRTLVDTLHRVHVDDRFAWQEAISQMAAGKKVPAITYRITRNDGVLRTFQATGQRVMHSDGPHLIGVTKDVTEEVRREAERRETEKLAALGQLAGGVAHEINNLLQPIISLSEMVQEDLSSLPDPSLLEEMNENLAIVMTCGRQAREIVRKILRYARQESPQVAPCEVVETMAASVSFLSELLSPGIALSITPTPGVEGLGRMNAAELTQVMTNLAINADHAMKGQGTLGITLNQIPLSATEAATMDCSPGDYFLIRVIDSGSGMDKATQARIFDPFFTTKPVGQGTGLGLSMVQGIVKGWGGAITVDSAVGQGTTFRLYIPAVPGQQG